MADLGYNTGTSCRGGGCQIANTQRNDMQTFCVFPEQLQRFYCAVVVVAA